MKDLKWSTLGPADALPGPATALATDDQDEDRLFVAGVSSEESAQPFLMEWDGSSWTDLSRDTLQSGSEFSQIAFVPLSSNTKDGDKDVIEQDRMLMVSGDLDFSEYGRVSSALFDGSNWMPFLVSATSAGGTGIVAALFYSAEHFRLSTDHLSVGIVILISIAIALGVVFLVVLIGLLLALKNRKADQKAAYPAAGRYNKDEDVIEEKGRRPTSLLATLNAATALVAADGATKSAAAKRETGPSQYDDDARSVGSDHLPMAGAAPARQSGSSDDHFFEADGMVDEDEEIVRMRYSFEYVALV